MPRWLANPGTFGYGTSVFNAAYDSAPAMKQDLAAAAKLVQEAGATGQTITIGTTSQVASLAAETGAYQQAAEAIGLKVKLDSVSADNYINFFTSASARKGVDGFITVNYGDYADPAALLATIALPGGSQNYDNFNDPQITSLLSQARGTADADARAALVVKAEKLAAQQLPWIPQRGAGERAVAERQHDRRGRLVLLHVRAVGRRPRRRSQGSQSMRFLARRLAMLAGSLLVASFVIFGALYLAPGSALAALSGGRAAPGGSVAILNQRYHLNDPFLEQYWYWLDGVVHGNLGISITLRENVSTLIGNRIWTTASLVLYASLIICVAGIGLGVLAGLRPGWLDTSALVSTAVTAAIPSFVAAIVLILVFAVKLGWFPALATGTGGGFGGDIKTFTLPAVALALSSLAIVARVTRAAIREEAEREHVQTAISRGLPMRPGDTAAHPAQRGDPDHHGLGDHRWRALIAVSAVVETAFSMNGLGAYLVQAAQSKDLAVVQGISLVLVTAFVVVNLLADLALRGARPAGQAGSEGAVTAQDLHQRRRRVTPAARPHRGWRGRLG